MAPNKYLSKLQNVLSQNQLTKLTKTLNEDKTAGKFGTVEEFKAQFNDMMGKIFTERLTPLLDVYLAAPFQKIDSETFNFMIDRIQDDLTAAFAEAKYLEQILSAHNILLKNLILRNLKHSIGELESRLNKYSILSSSVYGFDKAIASNFTGVSTSQLKRSAGFGGLFYDPKTRENSPYDNFIDEIGKHITLPRKSNSKVNITDIRAIYDSNNRYTAKVTEPEGLDITNLIDNKNGTFWIQKYMFFDDYNAVLPSNVQTKLELDLGGTKDINYLEIDPAMSNKATLTSVQAIRGDGYLTTIDSSEHTIFEHRFRLKFRKIAAQKIILTFTNETYKSTSYKVYDDQTTEEELGDLLPEAISDYASIDKTPNVEDAVITTNNTDTIITQEGSFDAEDSKSVKPSATTGISIVNGTITLQDQSQLTISDSFKSIEEDTDSAIFDSAESSSSSASGINADGTLIENNRRYQWFTGREFTIGFDNFRVGLATYIDTGISISQPLALSNTPKFVGVYTSEKRPLTTDGTTASVTYTSSVYDDTADSNIYLGNIEHYLLRKMYDENDNVITTDIMPILPIGVERVNREQLVLSDKVSADYNDSGLLQHYTDYTNGSIKVYKNDSETELTKDTDWFEESSLIVNSENTGKPMKYAIRIASPDPDAFYSVSYNPIVSNIRTTFSVTGSTHHNLIDLIGDLSAQSYKDNLIILDSSKNGIEIKRSEIFLVNIFRSNTNSPYHTPILENYTLAVTTKDDNKIEEI